MRNYKKRSLLLIPVTLLSVGQVCLAASLLDRGEQSYKQGNYTQAWQLFDQAVNDQPNDPFAYNERGMSLNALGKHSEALVDFDHAILLKPNLEIAYTEKARALLALGRWSESAECATKAIELDPTKSFESTSETYILRAQSYLKLGQPEKALADIKQCPRSLQQSDEVSSLKLQIANATKDKSAAVQAWSQLVACHPKDFRLLANLGTSEFNSGAFEQGIRHLKESLRLAHLAGAGADATGPIEKTIHGCQQYLARR